MLAEGISVGLRGLSPAAADRIRRLATYRNPEYRQALNMRLPVYRISRVVSLAEEDGERIWIPRG